MKDFDFKKALPTIGALLFFVAISLAFFYPQLQGEKLATHDQKQWKGGASELNEKYREGEIRLWTNSMFGGMPAYYVSMHYNTNIIAKYVRPWTSLGIDRPAIYIIWGLVSFFILLQVLRVNLPVSILGAVGYAFTSYNFVVLVAGHFAKVLALAYLPGILAGLILLKRKQRLWGFTLVALFMSFEMISNHPQMTYYFFVFFLVIYFGLMFFDYLKKGAVKEYFVVGGLFSGAVILGILPSMAQLMTTKEYTAHSTRGKSELTITNTEDSTSGLDRSYITNWSGGIAETWSLILPNAKGPGSGRLADHKGAMKTVDRQYKKALEGVDAYWGDQPFIGGPMYAGAIIMFLFVLGLFIVEGKLKWTIISSTVIVTMLSWGKNFPGLTNFFIDYFPMYNKFRAVVSIEIVALFAIPLLAALALAKLIKNKELVNEPLTLLGKETKYNNMMAIYASFALTGGVMLLFWLIPGSLFEFFKADEFNNYVSTLKQNGWQMAQITELLNNVESARMVLFKSDALRSFAFITVAFALIWAYTRNKLQANTLGYLLALLVLVDMWGVNTRYVDLDESFVASKNEANPFPLTAASQQILADKSPDYRVLNVAVSTFNETGTSNFHHSIGGYNGAKLKKYQELIDFYISKEIQTFLTGLRGAKSAADVMPLFSQMPILNMLNTKYVIYNPQSGPILNNQAQGGAWFVDNVNWVPTADDEMMRLADVDLSREAVIREDQKDIVGNVGDGMGSIRMVTYDLDYLEYQTSSNADQIAVFSEIWYPEGWVAKIDGEEVAIGRANYLLRTIKVPAGSHQITFEFKPASFYTGEKIALAGSLLLILSMAGSLFMWFKAAKKEA